MDARRDGAAFAHRRKAGGQDPSPDPRSGTGSRNHCRHRRGLMCLLTMNLDEHFRMAPHVLLVAAPLAFGTEESS